MEGKQEIYGFKMANAQCSGPLTTAPTPVMAQYLALKKEHADCLLFFRMGDFYELFYEDAVTAAQALDITLTRRGKTEGQDIPMCGVPFHAAENYLARLIRQGFRVAVSEQLNEPPTKAGGKTLMKRAVVRIVTPGTLTEETLLDAKRNNYLVSLSGPIAQTFSLCVCDVSTGAFWVENCLHTQLGATLDRLTPSELLLTETLGQELQKAQAFETQRFQFVMLSASSFTAALGESHIKRVFRVAQVEGLDTFTPQDLAAMGGMLDYILLTQKGQIPRLDRPKKRFHGKGLEIDPATRRNFELTQTISGQRKGSLLHLMDKTLTSAGARLLVAHLSAPLADCTRINERLEAVAWFTTHRDHLGNLRENLAQVADMERALSRLKLGRGGPRDLNAVLHTLQRALVIHHELHPKDIAPLIRQSIDRFQSHTPLILLLQQALDVDLPLLAREGGFIRPGYHEPLDEARNLRDHGRSLIVRLQTKYSEETKAPGLKIKHNNILGYYIELTALNAAKAPPYFIHRQTMAGAMRFTTVELSELEAKMITATDQALQLELQLFDHLLGQVFAQEDLIIETARGIAQLDVSSSLALLALENNYTRPQMTEEPGLHICGGRHPVVETTTSSAFIGNDCTLKEGQNIWLMTGPNMAGKSTFLRQNGLMVIMAQMGSFVPAHSAHMGVVDKLFSRVGASDDLASGRSTFMVEMVETATILNQATDRSLVILDEVGRGTSTFDGLSIAWAVIEYLAYTIRPLCLFATHYHELTTVNVPGLACYTMRIKEWEGQIFFLHEVVPGQADRSYGLHVAALAGLPPEVIHRAQEVLEGLERTGEPPVVLRPSSGELSVPHAPLPGDTLPALTPRSPEKKLEESPLYATLASTDIDALSPRQALEFLYTLKEQLP